MTKLFAGADEESGRALFDNDSPCFRRWRGRQRYCADHFTGLAELHDDATEFEFSPIRVCR